MIEATYPGLRSDRAAFEGPDQIRQLVTNSLPSRARIFCYCLVQESYVVYMCCTVASSQPKKTRWRASMRGKLCAATLILIISSLATDAPFAQQQDEHQYLPSAKPPPSSGNSDQPGQKLNLPQTFDTEAGTIIKGLSGVVSATQSPLASNYLSSNRTMLFRSTMQAAIIDAIVNNKNKITPFKGSKPSPQDVLCKWRGTYEVLAAQAVYLNSVSQTLSQLEMPVQYKNIIDALVKLNSQKLSIGIALPKNDPDEVKQKCEGDLGGDWTSTYYSGSVNDFVLGKEATTASIFSPLDEIETLLNVATEILAFFQQLRQQEEID
jgi:hypothetical protein